MSFKKFLTSRIFFKNLIAAMAITVALVTLTMWSLKIYTRHGQAFALPDLKGMMTAAWQRLQGNTSLDTRWLILFI